MFNSVDKKFNSKLNINLLGSLTLIFLSLHFESDIFNDFHEFESIRSIVWIHFETLHNDILEFFWTFSSKRTQFMILDFPRYDEYVRAGKHGRNMNDFVKCASKSPHINH